MIKSFAKLNQYIYGGMMDKEIPNQERRSVGSRILRASMIVAIAHICLKLISPLQYMLLSSLCDDATCDLFIFAFEGVLMMFFLIGEESLGPAFLPIFMQVSEKENEGAAWRFANTILTVQTFIVLLAILAVSFFPDELVRLITSWDRKDRPPIYMQLAPLYARYMILGLFGLSIGSTTYMLLNGYKRFFLAAFGDAAVKIGIVATLAFAWTQGWQLNGETATQVFAFAVIIGSLFKLATHLLGLRDKLTLFRPNLNLKTPAIRQFVWLILPLLLGIFVAKGRDIYTNFKILSTLDTGILSATAFGRKIFQTLSFLVPYSVSIAMLPFFCEMVERKDKDALGVMVTKSSRLILLMCMPLAALFTTLSLPISRLLFQGGEGGYLRCLQAATANSFYVLVLPFSALECIFMQTFFASRRMISVTAIGLAFSFLSMGLSYYFVIHHGFTGLDAIMAVALSFTFSRALKVISLGAMMRSFLPCFPAAATSRYLIKIFAIAAMTGLTAWGVRHGYEALVTIPREASRVTLALAIGPELILAGLVAGAVAISMMILLCREEFMLIREWITARLKHRKA